MVDQIIDRREACIPGPRGDVTPEALTCQRAAESARDAAQANRMAAEQAQHAAELARDEGRALSTELLPSDGTPFGSIPGLQAGTPDPLVEVSADKTAVVVHAHAGWIRAGQRMAGYALTADTRMPIPRPANWYDVEVLLDDAGKAVCRLSEASRDQPIRDPDSGLHLARYMSGPVQQDAITINLDAMLVSPTLTALKRLKALEGQRAKLADGTEYTLKDGVWEAATQSLDVVFKPQDAGSFQMMGTPMLHVRDGYIETDLTGVRVAVNVSRFPMLLWTSGPKPSRNIDLGYCYVYAPDPYYSKRLTWQTDGNLVVDDASNGDRLVPVFRRVPIPGGVTFG